MIDTITRQEVPLGQRFNITADLFGVYFPLRLEPFVYAMTSKLSDDYSGGYWQFYTLSNGGFYMATTSSRTHAPGSITCCATICSIIRRHVHFWLPLTERRTGWRGENLKCWNWSHGASFSVSQVFAPSFCKTTFSQVVDWRPSRFVSVCARIKASFDSSLGLR